MPLKPKQPHLSAEHWTRGKARHEGDLIVLEDPEHYRLFRGKGIPFALAGVRDPQDAVHFANTYGLLRSGRNAGEQRERFRDWQQDIDRILHAIDLYVTSQPGSDTMDLAMLLDECLSDVRIGVIGHMAAADRYSLIWQSHPRDLLGFAYYELAALMIEEREFRYCIECGRPFLVTDRRQQFDSPTCSNRVRHRRWVEGKRQRESAGVPVDAGNQSV